MCPVNSNIIEEPMFIFTNGSVHGNVNFKDVCPVKHPEQKAIMPAADTNLMQYASVSQPNMKYIDESARIHQIRTQRSGKESMIPFKWEIVDQFLSVYDVSPVYVPLYQTEFICNGNKQCIDALNDKVKSTFIVLFCY